MIVSLLDAEPHRSAEAGCRGPRGFLQPHRHRHAPHGRRLRRQGNPGRGAGLPVRGGRLPHRASGEDAPAAHGGHADHRQASPVLRRIRRRLRRRWPPARHPDRPGRQLRLLAGPLRLDRRPRHVPLGQRLLPRQRHHQRPSLQDQHRLEHRLPRFRRAPWNGRHRGDHGRRGPQPGQGSAGGAQAQLLRQGRTQRHPLPPDRRAQPAGGDDCRAGSEQRVRPPPRGNPCVQCRQPGPEERTGADPGEVRHFVHRDLPQPGRCADPHLYRRQHPPEPWRHRNGPGPQHQGRPGGRRGLPGRRGAHPDHRHQYRQGAQHLAHRRLLGHRPERQGRAECRRNHQAAPGGVRRAALEGQRGRRRVPQQPGAYPRADPAVRGTDPAGLLRPGLVVQHRLLPHAEDLLRPRAGPWPALLLFRLRRRLLGGGSRYPHRRIPHAAHRHPA